MGMFDTFYGDINCIECHKGFEFEEQTKDYECYLGEFLLGDYIDKGNRHYFYPFKTVCPHCGKEQEWCIAIKTGQIIGYLPSDEAKEININSLENIEDGYKRNLIYRQSCEKGLGFDKILADVHVNYNIGDIFKALETDWIIDEIYKEILDEDVEEISFKTSRIFYKDSLVLKVHNDKKGERLIHLKHFNKIKVCYNEFEQKKRWEKEDYENRYISQTGTILKKIG